MEARKQFDKLRRDTLKEVAAAGTLEAIAEVAERLATMPAGTYRHFDIEDFRKAIADREKALGMDREKQRGRAAYAKAEESDLARWANGEPSYRYFHTVRLRIRDGRVETSTGQSVSAESVRRALPVVLCRRDSFGPVRNLMVDGYPVVEQSTAGVKVGCTWVPWDEVERLQSLLDMAA